MDGTKYRVYVSKGIAAPCGMNSLHYIGNNWKKANEAFDQAPIGKDAWGESNTLYGVILSVWDSVKSVYVPKRIKGIAK